MTGAIIGIAAFSAFTLAAFTVWGLIIERARRSLK